jgi:hypothetical protein
MTTWRQQSELAGLFHPEFPDDLQVVVHDGEPRRSQRPPEACWVRVTGIAGTLNAPIATASQSPPFKRAETRTLSRTIFQGVLLNTPHGLTTIRQGAPLLFVRAAGVPHPLQVSDLYLRERVSWGFVPCDKCGADETFDPVSVMAKTRFPTAPAGAVPLMFSAFCLCGGTMTIGAVE